MYIEFTNPVGISASFTKNLPVLPPIFKLYPMKSLFSDNSLVVYKPHSLASGGVGTVKNSRAKAFKT
jgi:hypothetical protein